jgi:glycosyltransferase involved in cell wall biosynthesis
VIDVTVVIPCFNYGRYLEEAVQSALGQHGGAPRVVVVDDGSTEPTTLEVLERLPSEVEVVRQENRGVSAARNAGLARVETAFALLLDADDRLRPDALELLRPPLERDPALGFAYGRMRFFGDWEGVLHFPPYDPYALLYRHTIGLQGVLVRRQVLVDTGAFDEEFFHLEDWELWLNALEHGWRGRQIDAVTVEYRKHGPSKLREDRKRYRATYRRLRAKHAGLYARAGELAAESHLGFVGRLVHRAYWGPRPIPARLEQALYWLYFRA